MSEQSGAGAPAKSAEQVNRLAALFEAYWDRLYRLARRLVASADDALDLVQETFLKAARSSGSIPRGSSDEEAWLVRVLVNIRRDQWRREAVRKRHDLDSNPPARVMTGDASCRSNRYRRVGTVVVNATVGKGSGSPPKRPG